MKIVSRSEFLKMPKGTVFCKFPRFDEATRTYRKYGFGIEEPCIKMSEPGEMKNDFYSLGIGTDLEPVGCQGSTDFCEILEAMERNLGKEVQFDYSFGRDGMYETDSEVGFAIFSRAEVELVINTLQDALKEGYTDDKQAGKSTR